MVGAAGVSMVHVHVRPGLVSGASCICTYVACVAH